MENNNMNNNSEKKKNNTFIFIILVLIILGVIALVCYLLFFKNKLKENDISIMIDPNSNILNNENDNKNTETTPESNSIKLNNTKNYVYDANYKYNSKYYKYAYASEDEDDYNVVTNDKVTIKEVKDTVNTEIGKFDVYENVQYLKDLKVPYININSDDAKKVNQELEKLYMKYAKQFDENASEGLMCRLLLNYKTYTNNNILSIIEVDSEQCTDNWHIKYYTYNFDLTTGKLLTYKDIYTKAGIKENDIENKAEQAIISKQKEEMEDYEYPDNYPDGTNFDTYKNESISYYKKAVQKNTVKYYLGENNKLNIITTFSIPAGMGEFDYNIKIN